jgi:hypothetical protein
MSNISLHLDRKSLPHRSEISRHARARDTSSVLVRLVRDGNRADTYHEIGADNLPEGNKLVLRAAKTF